MSAKRTRPGSLASPAGAAELVRLRFGLLELYGKDTEFIAALGEAATAGGPADRTSRPAMVRGAYRLACRFGLDRLGPALTGHDADPEWWSGGLPILNHAGLAAIVAYLEDARVGHPTPFPEWTELGIEVPEPPAPVAVAVRWDPMRETRKDAERRASAEVRAALDVIGERARKDGLRWPDTRDAVTELRYLGWLFLRLRHRLSWQKLAERAGEEPGTVRPAVRGIAKRAGVRLAGGPSSP